MRKILIVGANGYIGSKLYSTLKKDGLDVYGIDNGLRNVVFKNDDIDLAVITVSVGGQSGS